MKSRRCPKLDAGCVELPASRDPGWKLSPSLASADSVVKRLRERTQRLRKKPASLHIFRIDSQALAESKTFLPACPAQFIDGRPLRFGVNVVLGNGRNSAPVVDTGPKKKPVVV